MPYIHIQNIYVEDLFLCHGEKLSCSEHFLAESKARKTFDIHSVSTGKNIAEQGGQLSEMTFPPSSYLGVLKALFSCEKCRWPTNIFMQK